MIATWPSARERGERESDFGCFHPVRAVSENCFLAQQTVLSFRASASPPHFLLHSLLAFIAG
jgi:hypothetical protein